MLSVLCVLFYLYASAGLSWVSTWREARAQRAVVSQMERSNAALRAHRAALLRVSTLQAEARRLGMVRPGERAYIVTGLPSN